MILQLQYGTKRVITGVEALLVVQYGLSKDSCSVDLIDFLTEMSADAGSI